MFLCTSTSHIVRISNIKPQKRTWNFLPTPELLLSLKINEVPSVHEILRETAIKFKVFGLNTTANSSDRIALPHCTQKILRFSPSLRRGSFLLFWGKFCICYFETHVPFRIRTGQERERQEERSNSKRRVAAHFKPKTPLISRQTENIAARRASRGHGNSYGRKINLECLSSQMDE